MARGNSSPVSATRNSEMPSTPRCHEMPSDEIHSWRETNWKPASEPPDVSKTATSQPAAAATPTANIKAIGRSISEREDGISSSVAAPKSGRITSSDRTGKSAIRSSPSL